MRTLLLLLTMAALLLTSCGLFDDEPVRHSFENEGLICFGSSPFHNSPGELTAGEPIELTVVFVTCLSSSCSQFEERDCTIEQQGDTLTISSHGAYLDTSSQHQACTADCGALSATCTGPALDEGTYTLVHGDDSFEIQIPGDEENTSCLGDE